MIKENAESRYDLEDLKHRLDNDLDSIGFSLMSNKHLLTLEKDEIILFLDCVNGDIDDKDDWDPSKCSNSDYRERIGIMVKEEHEGEYLDWHWCMRLKAMLNESNKFEGWFCELQKDTDWNMVINEKPNSNGYFGSRREAVKFAKEIVLSDMRDVLDYPLSYEY